MIQILILLSLIPPPLLAWSTRHHQEMGRLALEEVAPAWGLLKPVPPKPLHSFLQKLPRETSQHFSDWLGINPAVNIERRSPKEVGRSTLTPLEILSYYSSDPDDGRDQDLFVHDREGRPVFRYRDQRWFGSVTGLDSQAFRHIEKPPFSFRHPLATFGFPFRTLGEATRRAEIYYLLSRLAFSYEEDYWGWRFLASSFHYLQDLHNPYHAGQVTPELLLSGLKGYARWGFDKGEPVFRTIAHLVSNEHRFFETLAESFPILEEVRGNDLSPDVGSVRKLAEGVRDESNRYFPELTLAIQTLADPVLQTDYSFRSEEPPLDDPKKFLREGAPPGLLKRVEEIARERFRSAGRVLRGEVQMLLNSPREGPDKLLPAIETLLAPQGK